MPKEGSFRKRNKSYQPTPLDLSIKNAATAAQAAAAESINQHLMFEGKKFQQAAPAKKKHRTGRANLGYRSGSVPPLQQSGQGQDGSQNDSKQFPSSLTGGSSKINSGIPSSPKSPSKAGPDSPLSPRSPTIKGS